MAEGRLKGSCVAVDIVSSSCALGAKGRGWGLMKSPKLVGGILNCGGYWVGMRGWGRIGIGRICGVHCGGGRAVMGFN